MKEFVTRLKTFRADRRGNIAIMFGALIFAIVGAAGAAIDFMRIERARTALAEAGDAALLAAARFKGANPNASDAELTAVAKKLFDDSLKREHEINVSAFKITFNSGASAFRLDIDAGIDLLIMDVMGFDKQALKTSAEARLGKPPYIELAMALDVTGSMNKNNRLINLKKAARDLIETLFAFETATVKIGVVPFAQYVNVGTSASLSPWIAPPGPGWAGCVGSRPYPLNVRDDEYDVVKAPGLNGVPCPPPIIPLTDDKSSVLSAIDGLVADGWTYIPSGIGWGWSLLTPQPPFTDNVPFSELKKVNGLKALMIMTDGANTRAPDYPKHENPSAALANALTSEICENIKKQEIVVYTVAFELTNTSIKDILRNCATSPGHYFDAKDGKALSQAFNAIAASLRNISLSR